MDRLVNKSRHQALRSQRVRASLTGSATRPRLSVHISNHHITAQLINDEASKTLAYVSTVGHKTATGTLTDKAQWVGAEIAKQAASVKVKQVVYDRGSRLYHGRIKALAEAAREKGLEF